MAPVETSTTSTTSVTGTAGTTIDDDMRAIIDRAMLSYVATIAEDGSPAVSPKSSLRAWDDGHLVFMDIASPGTVANLQRDPRVEVDVVDVYARRGYRFKGTARIVEPGHPAHTWLNDYLVGLNGPGYPASRAVIIDVESIAPVLSPAYTSGNAVEKDLARVWEQRYHEAAGQ